MDNKLVLVLIFVMFYSILYKRIHSGKNGLLPKEITFIQKEEKQETEEKQEKSQSKPVDGVLDSVKKPFQDGDILQNNLKHGNDFEFPKSSSIQTKLSELQNNLPMEKVKQVSSNPIQILRSNQLLNIDKQDYTLDKNYIRNDIIAPNPMGSTEYQFVDEDSSKAWTDINVSQHPEHHTSAIKSSMTNVGSFFTENKMFSDKTSPYSENTLPDRCIITEDKQILCDYNNKLYNIPPRIVDSEENKFLDTTDIRKLKREDKERIEKTLNGGSFFNDVNPSEDKNEEFLSLSDVVTKDIKYSI